eukprot:CAMPEP_0195138142 /NCGR_PEP_ID=MMETSP0448-20130528/157226_1 /TAXON_ID=66468 /ORGANISM="Heterocapsa triquestra, Strain CCMP 448" /LENGTH=335 /DNA_ID=CAMNT_0040176399 /DNA_START=29 /DNA_END=1033 /DNA_ORIENTATION=-
MDRLGLMAVNENRDYGAFMEHDVESLQEELRDMAELVQRDRSHPSVLLWSFCNEVGCAKEEVAQYFRNVTYFFDGTRPVTQNYMGHDLHPKSLPALDVQGLSHRNGVVMDAYRRNNPGKAMVSTECCSCMSQRGVDQDFCPEPHDGGSGKCSDSSGRGASEGVFYNNEIAQCTADQVWWSDSRDFNLGTFVWSGFDYLGESKGWPQTVKCRGTIADVVGFDKESKWWLRSWWFSNISASDHGRPVLPDDEATVHIVDSWVPMQGRDTRSVTVYTNAPLVRLWLNGEVVSETMAVPLFGHALFAKVPFRPGNLTAEALDAQSHRLQVHSVLTSGVA